MMKKQTYEFIAGCVFNKMETNVFEKLKQIPATECNININSHEMIPKIWFGISSSHEVTNDITGDAKYWLKDKLEMLMADLLPKFETTIVKIVPDNQYIRFDYNVVKKVPVKKMTVEQIEKELGYKVEIVSEVTE